MRRQILLTFSSFVVFVPPLIFALTLRSGIFVHRVHGFSTQLMMTPLPTRIRFVSVLRKGSYQFSGSRMRVPPIEMTHAKTDDDDDLVHIIPKKIKAPESYLAKFSLMAPVWTTLAAIFAVSYPLRAQIFGSLAIMRKSLMTLMFAMGLAITPKDVSKVLSNPKIIALNGLLCYGIAPLLALIISKLLDLFNVSQTNVGLLLLASVSGGQASNLFTMIAGGDVALSVICTLSTTLLGVVATPLLVKGLLGQSVQVDTNGVVRSVASMVLLPLLFGLSFGQILPPKIIKSITPVLPTLGVLATIILVIGGASNLQLKQQCFGSVVLPSCLLCLASGVVSWWFVNQRLKGPKEEATKRALVIETLSKSPTLAYVLACQHFEPSAKAIPAAAMVTLAILGASIASLWSILAPIEKKDA
jgi:BASS family bile acid:Na+ symporter